jgi:hypothetical protein
MRTFLFVFPDAITIELERRIDLQCEAEVGYLSDTPQGLISGTSFLYGLYTVP